MTDLTATRAGDDVHLRFTPPDHTTDGQPLRSGPLTGSLCRQLGTGPCVPLPAEESHTLPVATGTAMTPVNWTDTLPPALRSGPARAVGYRVELRNAAGRTAGYSDPAYVAAGEAPPPVEGLRVEGVRQGIALHWTPRPGAGEVLLERQGPAGAATKKAPADASRTRVGSAHHAAPDGVEWLQANPGDRSAAATLDANAAPGMPYTYTAVRRTVVQLGGRTLELRSAPSAPVSFTWRDVYPPAAPTELSALGYTPPAPADAAPDAAATPPGYAVDLIWQPVLDDRLAGYLVYRQPLDAAGQLTGERVRLTPQPLPTPGFHDATAVPGQHYRYGVTAIDPAGNESPADAADLEGLSSKF